MTDEHKEEQMEAAPRAVPDPEPEEGPKRSKDPSRAGTYYEPWPLDFKLLRMIPKVGTVGGVHWQGRRVKDLVDELTKEQIEVTNEMVTARLRSMAVAGHTKSFGGPGGTRIWAKTLSGVKLEKEEQSYGA